MLDRLLESLRAGGTRRVADLARELGTTPAFVEAMLDDLVRMGYLRCLGGECGGGCAACPLAGLCAAGKGGRVWSLTEGQDATPGTKSTSIGEGG
jgi:hypothetical protein